MVVTQNSSFPEGGVELEATVSRRRLHYGWLMVAVSFVVAGVGSGNQYFNGILIQPRKEMFHATTAIVVFCSTGLMTLVSGLGSPVCGVLLRRYSIRAFMIGALLLVGLGYVGLAYASRLWQVAVINGVLFSVGLLVTSLTAYALVANWFVKHRGVAMGIVTAGLGAAGLLIPPLATDSIERHGLSYTCWALALVAFLLMPIVAWLVVDEPEQKGWRLSEEPSICEPEGPTASAKEWTLARVIKHPLFWSVTAISGACMGVSAAMVNNLMPLVQSTGLAWHTASFLVSGMAVSAMVGLLLFGKVFDVVAQRTSVQLLIGLIAVPCLLFMGHPSYPLLLTGVILLGLGQGGIVLLPAVLCGINFGRDGFAIAYGALNPFFVALPVAGMSLFGWVYDVYGTYNPALTFFLLLLVVTFAAAYLLPADRAQNKSLS